MVASVEPTQIGAVVVFYHPDQAAIEHVKRLAQYLTVIIIDNSDNEQRSSNLKGELTHPTGDNTNDVLYIANQKNLGIATALNQGLEQAISIGKQWCLLLDQDSVVDCDFVQSISMLPNQPLCHIAAIVPRYYANNLQKFGDIIQVTPRAIKRIAPETLPLIRDNDQGTDFVDASYAITSGSMVNLANLENIGLHDESLFIDFVDIEWGLRANHKGFRIVTNLNATLQQQLGEQPIRLMGLNIVNHSPIRHYYYFRNVLLMLRKKHVPLIWKLVELAKLPVRFTLYSTLTSNRKKQCQSMLQGLWHGLLNKKGKKTQ
ncbi:glycosyltransferase family 2 protein [Vibrio astriarenae]